MLKTFFNGLQKQRPKTSYVTKPMTINTSDPHTIFLALLIIINSPFKGSPCSVVQGEKDSYSRGHFLVEVRANPLLLDQQKLMKI